MAVENGSTNGLFIFSLLPLLLRQSLHPPEYA
jgi:hypothetical protein